jgi:hypothetical protein
VFFFCCKMGVKLKIFYVNRKTQFKTWKMVYAQNFRKPFSKTSVSHASTPQSLSHTQHPPFISLSHTHHPPSHLSLTSHPPSSLLHCNPPLSSLSHSKHPPASQQQWKATATSQLGNDEATMEPSDVTMTNERDFVTT